MCRLALLNDEMVRMLGIDVLAYHFQALENKLGGDGMGVGALFSDGRVKTHKGVNQTADNSAEWIFTMSDLGATHYIFHTRLATTGSKRDRNCHPFRHGSLVGAHNGTCIKYKGVGGIDLTDSEGAYYTVSRAGLPLSYLEDVSGVWIGFRNGSPFVVKGQGWTDLELATIGDTAYMYTSTIFKEEETWFDKIHTLREYEWYGDVEQEGKPRTKKVYSNVSYSYYDSDSWYDSGTSTGYKNSTYGKRVDGTWGYLTDRDKEDLKQTEKLLQNEIAELDDEEDTANDDVNKAVIDAIARDTDSLELSEDEAYTKVDIIPGMYFHADGSKYVWNGDDFIPESATEPIPVDSIMTLVKKSRRQIRRERKEAKKQGTRYELISI